MASSKDEREFEITGTLNEDGTTVLLDHPSVMKRILRNLINEKLLIKVSKLRYKRSDAQNRYIWGVIVPCVKAWHFEEYGVMKNKDEIYLWLRIGLLGHKAEVSEVMGVQVITMTGKRFSKMNTKEFTDAIDEILKSMAEKGCVIPEPRQHNFINEFVDDK